MKTAGVILIVASIATAIILASCESCDEENPCSPGHKCGGGWCCQDCDDCEHGTGFIEGFYFCQSNSCSLPCSPLFLAVLVHKQVFV